MNNLLEFYFVNFCGVCVIIYYYCKHKLEIVESESLSKYQHLKNIKAF